MHYRIVVRLTQVLFGLLLLLGGSQAFAQCTGNLTTAALFTQTNPDGIANQAVAYYRSADGSLCEAGRYATGGTGSVVAIMNGGRNSVLLVGNCLLVANGGPTSLLNLNGSVSSFQVSANSLRLVGNVPSRGMVPVSVTVRGNSGYVVNDLSNNINGFTFNPASCAIAERPNTLRTLNSPRIAALGNPAQIQYTPDGKFLVVTDRYYPGPSQLQGHPIHVLAVNSIGLAVSDTVTLSDGIMPFGFDFDDAGHLFVSNAGEPFFGLSSATSYRINSNGTLTALSDGQVLSGQSGACWVSYTKHTDKPVIYVMSLIGAVISSYTVAADGSLTLLEAVAASFSNPLLPEGLEITLSEAATPAVNQYLYGINTTPVGFDGIVRYRVERTGKLTQLGPVMNGPSQAFFGLAAR